MNINGLPHAAQNQVAPKRLDVTANAPAEPEGFSGAEAKKTQAAANREAVGSIKGVLSNEENEAIREVFGRLRSGYTFSGANQKASVPPGIRLNLSA